MRHQPINWKFRPHSYHFELALKEILPRQIKGELRQQLIAQILRGENAATILTSFSGHRVDEETRQLLSSIHPQFMGGEYLPDLGLGEVEIARVTLDSTTMDVTCVFASPHEDGVRYRIVDEYGGDTLTGKTEIVTAEYLTLEDLVDFLLTVWDLRSCLECNFDDWANRPNEVHGFIYSIRSDFYPDFGLAVSTVVDHWMYQARCKAQRPNTNR